jgi:restriction endonuclease S subunit
MLAEPIFERRLDEICEGCNHMLNVICLKKISQENTSTIIEYVLALKTETNLSLVYKEAVVNTLSTLAKFHGGSKSFKNMTRNDILKFLDRLRKTEEQDRIFSDLSELDRELAKIPPANAFLVLAFFLLLLLII